MLMRVGADGSSSQIDVKDWESKQIEQTIVGGASTAVQTGVVPNLPEAQMITNADQGTVLTWEADAPAYCASGTYGFVTCNTQVAAASTYGFATTVDTNVAYSGNTLTPIYPALQAQDGSFYGTDNNGNMISFSQYGNVIWSVPNDYPQIATADGGVIGASGVTYDNQGRANGQIANLPIQSWTQTTFQYGSVDETVAIPVAPATPDYASFVDSNQSSNGASPLCHDDGDQLIKEYGDNAVLDSFFKLLLGGDATHNNWPRFTPNCFELTSSAHSANFTFSMINNPGPNEGPAEFLDRALIKFPLIAPVGAGFGLDTWLQEYGAPRTISSGYRDPVQNGGAGNSRHMLGDAADFQSVTYSQAEFDKMNTAALLAGADFIENHKEYCAKTLHCAHADWRYHSKGEYAH
jgi:hypothetical protein